MGNVCWSPCGLLLFFLISTISCVASVQITSNSPSIHDGDVTAKKLISTTISNVKMTQSIPLEEVEDRRAYGGRKMKNDVVKKAMAEKVSSSEEDGVEQLIANTSSNKEYHSQANLQEEDDMSEKKEASSEQETMADERKRARKQFKTTDMDSFVSYADYPGPHHHPPKNN